MVTMVPLSADTLQEHSEEHKEFREWFPNSSGQTSPVPGGHSSQLTGLKGAAAGVLVSDITHTFRGLQEFRSLFWWHKSNLHKIRPVVVMLTVYKHNMGTACINCVYLQLFALFIYLFIYMGHIIIYLSYIPFSCSLHQLML